MRHLVDWPLACSKLIFIATIMCLSLYALATSNRLRPDAPAKPADPVDKLVGTWRSTDGSQPSYEAVKIGKRCLMIKNPTWPAVGYWDGEILYVSWDDTDYIGHYRLCNDGMTLEGGYRHRNVKFWPDRWDKK